MSVTREALNAIRMGRIDTAIEQLFSAPEVQHSDLADEVVLLSGQFAQWQRSARLGLKTDETTRNRIADALLYIIRELEARTTYQHESDLRTVLADCPLDLSELQQHLAQQNFAAADAGTEQLFKQMGSGDRGLTFEELPHLPCTTLRAIDTLWNYYSQGKFGLSVQLRQLLESAYDENRFGEAIGWRKNGLWIAYSELKFSLLAPKGHLPAIGRTGGVAFFSAASLGKGIPGMIEGQFEVFRSGVSDLLNPGGIERFAERFMRETGIKKGGNGFALWWMRSRISILNRYKQCRPT